MALEIPPEAKDCVVVASVSGGKDSTAMILALRESGIAARHVFADTGWEAASTYEYLEVLRVRLGIAIDVVGAEGGMVAKVRKRSVFPARKQRWCTRELKIDPLRGYHDRIEEASGGLETLSVMGIRRQESEARAAMVPFADDDEWGGFVWRPLLDWTIEDVIAIHHRHDVPLNPLYLKGHDRVGCYPCIYSRKEEIRLIAENDPERIDQIRALEAETTAERLKRNAETPGRYAHPQSTFFQTRLGASAPMGIDAIVDWSRTSRGGRQLKLLAEPPSGGCMRWGICEAPPTSDGEVV